MSILTESRKLFYTSPHGNMTWEETGFRRYVYLILKHEKESEPQTEAESDKYYFAMEELYKTMWRLLREEGWDYSDYRQAQSYLLHAGTEARPDADRARERQKRP